MPRPAALPDSVGKNGSLPPEFVPFPPLTWERSGELPAPQCSEAFLQVFAHRLVMAHEAERSRLSLELHDHITQLVCGIILRCQKLAGLLTGNEKAQSEALILGELMGQAADEVERISCHLRPGVLETLGLEAALRASITEFAERTGLTLTPAVAPLTVSLPAEADLALYRILQESLKNVEQHAHAHVVNVCLMQDRNTVQLTIQDDGVGFDPGHLSMPEGLVGVGLVGMRERASCVGGALQVVSAPNRGTLVRAQIPFTPPGTLKSYASHYRSAC